MLKFIKQHLTSISGIEIYPLISFLVFFTFFVAIAIWALCADKNFISTIKNLPLDDDKQ